MRREHVAQGLHRLLRPALLDEADRRVEDDDGEDHRRVGDMAEDRGDDRGADENVDEEIVELPDEADQDARPGRFGQHVGAVRGEPPRGFRGLQPLWAAAEGAERAAGLRRVPACPGRYGMRLPRCPRHPHAGISTSPACRA